MPIRFSTIRRKGAERPPKIVMGCILRPRSGCRRFLVSWFAAGARLRGEKVDRARVAALLEQVELSSCADARPATLSGGMRQRAALARTLYEDRPIVLMDEPFSALDTLTRTRIQTLAATLLAGRTVVLITHDPQEACRLSHRLLVLSAADGDIDDSHHLAGTPPRAPDAPDLLIGQAALLQQLMRAQP